MTRPPRCSDAAEQRADVLWGSAPPVEQWLLLEHPGPWGRHILTGSGLDPALARELSRWAARTAGRVALIRRPGTPRGGGAPRRWYVADSRPGRERVRWGFFVAEPEVLDAARDPDAGQVCAEPLYLVCTHGKHDVCCALRGRPVAAALAADHPERTWECSHVGGDRFAANLVLLPHGLYHGHVSPAVAGQIVRDYDHGRLSPRWLRGRSSLPAPVQAAQHHARAAHAQDGLDSYPPITCARSGPDEWTVELAGPPGLPPLTVVVRARTQAADGPLTCSATTAGRVQVFDLVDLR